MVVCVYLGCSRFVVHQHNNATVMNLPRLPLFQQGPQWVAWCCSFGSVAVTWETYSTSNNSYHAKMVWRCRRTKSRHSHFTLPRFRFLPFTHIHTLLGMTMECQKPDEHHRSTFAHAGYSCLPPDFHVYAPILRSLDATSNKISNLDGLEHCASLETLILDDNGLRHNLKLPFLPELRYYY